MKGKAVLIAFQEQAVDEGRCPLIEHALAGDSGAFVDEGPEVPFDRRFGLAAREESSREGNAIAQAAAGIRAFASSTGDRRPSVRDSVAGPAR